MTDQDYMTRVHQQVAQTKSYVADNTFWLSQVIQDTPTWHKLVDHINNGAKFLYSCRCYRKRLAIIMYHERENT